MCTQSQPSKTSQAFINVGYLLLLFLLTGCQSNSDQSTGQSKTSVVDKQVIAQEDKSKIANLEITEAKITKPKYKPFPEGYGYMENIKELQQATDNGNMQVIREHAWSLWAGIMQPVDDLGWPDWYTWPNTKGAFKADDSKIINETKPKKGESIRAKNKKNLNASQNLNTPHAPSVNTPSPTYNVPVSVIKKYPDAICSDRLGKATICDGTHFVNNGDIMIATESLSKEAMDDIRHKKLYMKSTLDKAHKDGQSMIEVTDRFIVTKHMYWPVKAQGVTAIPVWKDNYPDSHTGYAGYEDWGTLVALEPDNKSSIGKTVAAEFLYHVLDHCGHKTIPTVKSQAVVQDINDFYHHKVTKEDWNSFDPSDQAIITAASLWANNSPFEIGDYLVSIAMHVNTKELDSWTLQSVWWSDTPNEGIYAENRPKLPQAQGPWNHYLLTDAYAIPAVYGKLKKAVNPYIEGVIHPIATNCRNCHVRAGWPDSSYQNSDCPDLLEDLTPESACLKDLTLTDYLWIIPDRAQ
jgi:hypothetical protein